MSQIDEFFKSIYGKSPKKDGTAYEMLAAAVVKLLSQDSCVKHDEQLRGVLSKTLYQIDVLEESEGSKKFGEAKDYTDRNAKVGRPDLQKLGGALPDLPVDGGVFYSATDYTKPAKKYAENAKQITGKPIDLMHIRPSTEKDEEGRIKTIVFRIHIVVPDYDKGDFRPMWTLDGQRTLNRLVQKKQLPEHVSVELGEFYDRNGAVLKRLSELTAMNLGGSMSENAKASFWLPDCYVKLGEHLIPIHGLTYDIPYSETVEQFEIKADGTAKLLVKSELGGLDKLITDKQLDSIEFDTDGNPQLKEHKAR